MDVRRWLEHTNPAMNRNLVMRKERSIRTHISKMQEKEDVWQRDKFSRQGNSLCFFEELRIHFFLCPPKKLAKLLKIVGRFFSRFKNFRK